MSKTTLLACVFLIISGSAWGFSGQGNGSFRRPYIITNVTELQQIDQQPDACYILKKDIDASETTAWNDGMGFKPIGRWTDCGKKKFTGTFDGRGHKITGLYINMPNDLSVGLFGVVGKEGVIRNLSLCDADVTGRKGTGALVGSLAGGVIVNCKTSGKVTCGHYYGGGLCGGTNNEAKLIHSSSSCKVSGYRYTGGFCGIMNGLAKRCFATGEVFGSYGYAGGFVGNSSYGTFKQCYATGSVKSTISNAGGFMGGTTRSDYVIEECYATGNVTSMSHQAGGFIGDNTTGIIKNCYAAGSAEGIAHIGGFVGINHGKLLHCYSTGKVSSTKDDSRTGGFCGTDNSGGSTPAVAKPANSSRSGTASTSSFLRRIESDPPSKSTGAIIQCYYDKETSGQNDSEKGLGVKTTSIKKSSTFEGFDFDSIWAMKQENCEPVLRWMLAPLPSISIDITPGNCFNNLNITEMGTLTVAIIGTKDFEVSKVDIASITLQGVSPIRSSYADVSTTATPDRCCRVPDNIQDLVLKFDKKEILLAIRNLKNIPNNTETTLTLKCILRNDQFLWQGSDYVRICGK